MRVNGLQNHFLGIQHLQKIGRMMIIGHLLKVQNHQRAGKVIGLLNHFLMNHHPQRDGKVLGHQVCNQMKLGKDKDLGLMLGIHQHQKDGMVNGLLLVVKKVMHLKDGKVHGHHKGFGTQIHQKAGKVNGLLLVVLKVRHQKDGLNQEKYGHHNH